MTRRFQAEILTTRYPVNGAITATVTFGPSLSEFPLAARIRSSQHPRVRIAKVKDADC